MTAPSPKFLDISPGASVRAGAQLFRVEAATTATTVLAQNLADGSYSTLDVALLAPAGRAEPAPAPAPDLVADAAAYGEAAKRLEVIRPLLADPLRTRSDVERAAKSAGRSAATVYAWMRTYEDSPQLSSLIPGSRGPDKGVKLLDARREAIITAAIDKHHRVAQRKRASTVATAVKDACKAAGISPPHANTVRKRVRALPRAATLRSQGRTDEARDTYDPATGTIPDATTPLSIVQMDHGLANVEIVDERLRLALGRPWVTVAIDVCTRVVVGLVVSLERPSGFAAGRCVANLMLPKDGYLRRLGVSGDWAAWGKPGTVHLDNAKEFRGGVLKTGLAEYGIQLALRKVKTPHYGGYIERYMRTLSDAMRDLPGATFANPEERKGYNSSERAAMTLAEFEAWLVDYIVNVYHQKPHDGLNGTPPAAAWRDAILGGDGVPGAGLPAPPADPERLLDFLPFEWRTVGRRGLLLDYIHYWNDGLRHRIAEADPENPKAMRKFLVRIDPRDVTRVWFRDPDTNAYSMVPTLDLTRPPVSRWEWKEVQKALQAQGAGKVDEERLFQARARLEARADEAAARTKSARRALQRGADARKHAAEGADRAVPRVGPSTAPAMSATPATVPGRFDEPVERFDEIDA